MENSLATKPKSTDRAKHIDLKSYHIRELVTNGVIYVQHVPTARKVDDILTKAPTRIGLEMFVTQLNVNGFKIADTDTSFNH